MSESNSIAIAKLQTSLDNLVQALNNAQENAKRTLDRLEKQETDMAVQISQCNIITSKQKEEFYRLDSNISALEKSNRKIWEILNKSKGAQIVLASCCGAVVSIIVGVSIQVIKGLLP